MPDKVALVVGITGIVGLNLAKRLLIEKWKVYGISRRKPDYLPKEIQHVAVDLTDAAACNKAISNLKDVKYVFYSTWQNRTTEKENCVVNKAMTENAINGLADSVKHFVLVTGTKQYMGPFDKFAEDDMPTPFKESLPRLPNENFYYDQEDALFEGAKKKGFTWSVARPHTMIGFAPYNQMNLGTSIAVYASICKHLNIPFIFPGGTKGYNIFLDATDADLLAEHLIWEATNPAAANQAFNVVNGDIFRWKLLWQSVADYFGVTVEKPGDKPLDMHEVMKDKGPVWDEIVAQHGLQKFKLENLVSWWHVNVDVGRTVSCPTDMSKSREMGFLRYENTEKAYFRLFDFLRENKYIPGNNISLKL